MILSLFITVQNQNEMIFFETKPIFTERQSRKKWIIKVIFSHFRDIKRFLPSLDVDENGRIRLLQSSIYF